MAYYPTLQTFQVLAPIPMPITASSYTEAVKNYVKMHRNASINQLIIQDQINNNRMLANIKYYTTDNRNKFRASLAPTQMTALSGGMMTGMMGPRLMGSTATGRPFVGPMLGGPMLGGPMMMSRTSNPYSQQTSPGSVFAPGTTIGPNTIIGPQVSLPNGTILPATTVITAIDNLPLNINLPTNSNIPVGVNWTRGASMPPGALPIINAAGAYAGTVGGAIAFPAGINVPAGAVFPINTYISPQANLVGVTLPSGTEIPLGTVFNPAGAVGTTLPAGSIIVKGTNIPAGTNLVGVSLPSGTHIDLTNLPLGQSVSFPNPIIPGNVIFNLAPGNVVPAGSTFPSGFKFVPPTFQSSNVLIPAPVMTGIVPMGRPMYASPRHSHRRRHRHRSRSSSPRRSSPRRSSPRRSSPRQMRYSPRRR
jgi:hypothetical protein